MTTISKFYLLDAASPNTGTMPSTDPSAVGGGPIGTGSSATGASTARDATDVAGSSNPDLEAVITAQAAATSQVLGYRRFVSRPLAARTFATADGNWTFDFAAFDSNTNHTTSTSDGPQCIIYPWRPSTGLRVGTVQVFCSILGSLTTSEAHFSISAGQTWNGTQAILDGDILVFDVYASFTQGMAVAYTESFSYNGTTEASTTTCASFITPPAALTLFTASAGETSAPSLSPLTMMLNQFRPFWLPKLGFLLPDPSFPVAAATEVERPIQVFGQGVNRSNVY